MIRLKFGNSPYIENLEDFLSFLSNPSNLERFRSQIAEKMRKGIIITWLRQINQVELAEKFASLQLSDLSDTDVITYLIDAFQINSDIDGVVWEKYMSIEKCSLTYEKGIVKVDIYYTIIRSAKEVVPVVMVFNHLQKQELVRINLSDDVGRGRLSNRFKLPSEPILYDVSVLCGEKTIAFDLNIRPVFEFINDTYGHLKIAELKHFSNGFSLVQSENKMMHFLNCSGQMSPGFEDARLFTKEGFAAVKYGGLWGFMNTDLECVTGFVYDRLEDFSEGKAYFEKKDGISHFVERGFLDVSMKVSLDLSKNYSGSGLIFDDAFHEGLFKIWSDVHIEWIDHNGRIVDKIMMCEAFSNYHYNGFHVSPINRGVVRISYSYWTSFTEQCQVVANYDILGHKFLPGLDLYSEDGYTYTRLLLKSRFVEDPIELTSFVVEEYSDYAYIDRNGEEMCEYKFKNARAFSEHFAAVSIEQYGGWGFINTDFKPICDYKYSGVGHFAEGFAAVDYQGKWGFINASGKEVIPCEYEDAHHFSEGLAPVKKSRKWGFVNCSGKLVIPCVFDDVTWFSEGYTIATYNNIKCFIDKSGKPLHPQSDWPEQLERSYSPANNAAVSRVMAKNEGSSSYDEPREPEWDPWTDSWATFL